MVPISVGYAGQIPVLRHSAYSISNWLMHQARLLAYIDNFFLMGLLVLTFVPLAFLMKRSQPGQIDIAH